jgi:hypothetical protein
MRVAIIMLGLAVTLAASLAIAARADRSRPADPADLRVQVRLWRDNPLPVLLPWTPAIEGSIRAHGLGTRHGPPRTTDEVFPWSSPPESWTTPGLSGSAGYAIARDGRVLDYAVMMVGYSVPKDL